MDKKENKENKVKQLERYLQMPTERSPVWLDDQRVAYIRHDQQGDRIWMLNLQSGERSCLTSEDVRTWALYTPPEGQILYYGMDASGSECEQIFRLIPGEKPEPLTREEGVRHLLAGVSGKGRYLIYASNERSSQSFDIRCRDLENGEDEILQFFEDHYNWPCPDALSRDGRYVLYNKLKGESDNALWMTDVWNRTSQRIPEACAKISAETDPAWKNDGSGFFFLSDRDSEFYNVWYYNMENGQMRQLYSYGWDAARLAVSADDRFLAVFVNEAGYTKLHLYDLSNEEEVQSSSCPKSVLSNYQQACWSPTGHRMLFTLESGSRPLGIWMLDLDCDLMQRLSEYELTSEERRQMVEPELCSFCSFDGLEIPYWLYLPKGKKAENLPIMIEIHGGPEGQEQPSFEAFYQYLLREGIAIVAPNVRGSTGYGKRYTHLDDVEKRLDSVRDIAALVEHLVEKGLADPRRLAVSGTSYGGFMTLSCAARFPGLWACAVDTVGMYDLVTFLENTADYRRAHRESEYGTLAHDRKLLKEVSPVSKIHEITAPIMIVQGKNDPRVPVTEAEQAVAALKALGRTVEYLCYDDEGHGISKMKNKLDCYPKVAGFLKKYLLDGQES